MRKTLCVLATLFLIGCVDSELPEKHGKVSYELYPGDGENQPLIVGLGGSEGGNAWTSDRWKSSRDKFLANGYAFMALEYFGGPETPDVLDRISIDAIHDAIVEVSKNEKINKNKIAIIGGSKGAELALLLASHYPDINCVVAMTPAFASFPALTMMASTSSWTYKNQEVTFVPVPWSATGDLMSRDLRSAFSKMLEDTVAVEAAKIEIENINGPILFVSATKDEMWPSTEMAEVMMKRLDEKKFKFEYEHIVDEGGHTNVFDHFDEVIEFLNKHYR